MSTLEGEVQRGVKPRVGISLCLLGDKVRHDGGHKLDQFVTEVLAEYFEWVPVCPEVELGMGVPREPIRLVSAAGGDRLVGVDSGTDWTDRMSAYAEDRVTELVAAPLHGFILKKGSPSCGLERVARHDAAGLATNDGVGAFARVLLRRLPALPVEEEGHLSDDRRREDFISRVYTYRRMNGT